MNKKQKEEQLKIAQKKLEELIIENTALQTKISEALAKVMNLSK
jgi:hypothetical protein